MNYKFKNLVFEGGGIKSIAFAGAINALERKGVLDNIERVAGTSSGAIAATLVSLGFTYEERTEIFRKLNFSSFKDSYPFPFSLINPFFNYGLFKGKAFQRWFEKVISAKVDKNITFGELAAKDEFKKLYMVGTDLSRRRGVVFSHETHKDMPISKAIRISMSLPVFFNVVRLNKRVFIDGGLYYNYPLNIFDNKKYLFDKNHYLEAPYDQREGAVYNKETLGLRVDNVNEITSNILGTERVKRVRSLLGYALAVVDGYSELVNKRHLHKNDWHRTVHVDSLGVGVAEFGLENSKRLELFRSGERGVKIYFDWFDTSEEPLNK